MAISLALTDIDKILGIAGPDDGKDQAGAESASTSSPTAAPMPKPLVPPINQTPEMEAPKIGSDQALADANANSLIPKISDASEPQKPTKAESIAAGKSEFAEGMPKITAMPGTPEHGEQKQEVLEYQQAHPWGSDVSAQPGVLGKIGHVAAKIGNIAGDVFAPSTMALIPGTQLNNEMQSNANQREIAQGTENELKGAQTQQAESEAVKNLRTDPTAGKTPEELTIHDLMTGNNGQPKVNPDTQKPYTYLEAYGSIKNAADTKNAPKDTIETLLATATAAAQKAGVDPTKDPTVMQLQAVKAGSANPNIAEQNKMKFQTLASGLASEGLSTQPDKLSSSIKASKTLKPEDKAFMAGYMATNPNPSTTYNIGEEKTAAANADKFFSYTDASGTHLVKGKDLPPEAAALPVKDPEALVTEGRTANIIQKSLNQIALDVRDHAELWDNAAARSIMATTLEQIDRESAGMLIAGTGGSIPLPSGMGDMINTALQNKGLDKQSADALKQYIADYKSMKDKVVAMQMEMQNGKMGRGSAQAFKAIADQIPNGATPDSKTAQRQVRNLFQTQEELMQKYPESYGNYSKEPPAFRVGGQ